ncbi:hypothetical protein SNE40_017449 [Patella caerulea]|uniref:Ubiquitin-like domain-containing protein n=1 Tax=Patella caerulea TaxID=87958 RepID=A0AAN8JB58_PATCE
MSGFFSSLFPGILEPMVSKAVPDYSESSYIDVYIERISNGSRFIIEDISRDLLVASLKDLIQDHNGIPPNHQKLFYIDGDDVQHTLKNHRKLSYYGVTDGSTIYLADLRTDDGSPRLRRR